MKKVLKWIGIVILVIIVIAVISSFARQERQKSAKDGRETNQKNTNLFDKQAIDLVAKDLDANETKIDVNAEDLKTKLNPKGEGVFVYHPETEFSGVERFFIWLVIDGQAYSMNGASKDITPHLSWPREANDDVWAKTGLDKYQATEAIEMVFGKK